MKKINLIILFAFISLICKAPDIKMFIIHKIENINPYEHIWKAICEYESKNDPLAWNEKENAVGIAQIRPIRLLDYNRRTGKNYSLKEMHDIKKSREVFMYYAHRLKHPEKIIRKWNGSGPKTITYLHEIQKIINKNL